jgi:DNA end-binding protein Ku
MALRPFWKGYLKLSLVTCPVAMTPAVTESGKLRFHTLNRASGERVVSQYVDEASGKPVADADEARGYRRGEDDYVLLEQEELDAVALESARTIDIDRFAPAESIGWLWYDAPHYLVPDDTVGVEAFCVIRDAMAATGTVGIARLVLYRRERAVMLRPEGRGIVLWTLRFGDEVRDAGDYFGSIGGADGEAGLKRMMTTLIKARTTAWDPAMVADPVQENLRGLIAAKKKGRKRAAKPAKAPAADNVISITDALRRSLAAERGDRRKPGGR